MQTKNSQEELNSVLKSNYAFGEIQEINDPEKGYGFNVKVIVTAKDKYIFRYFNKTEKNYARVLLIGDLLEENFNTPEIIKNKSGNNYIDIGNSCIIITKFINGNHPGTTEKDVINNAKLLAKFHNLTENKAIPSDNNDDDNNLKWIYERIGKNINEIEKLYSGREFKKDYELMLKYIKKPNNNNSVNGVAHNDFKSDNIFINENGKYFLLDMFNMESQNLISDVAKYIKSDCLKPEDPNERQHLINRFLTAYIKERPNMKKDLAYINDWIRYWCSVTFFFFMCQYNKADCFRTDIFKEAQQAVKDIDLIEGLNCRFI